MLPAAPLLPKKPELNKIGKNESTKNISVP